MTLFLIILVITEFSSNGSEGVYNAPDPVDTRHRNRGSRVTVTSASVQAEMEYIVSQSV